jgi:hypothetical protein
MPNNNTANILVIVLGVGILAVSLLADVTGIGTDPVRFGDVQTIGAIAGAVILGTGLFLKLRAR